MKALPYNHAPLLKARAQLCGLLPPLHAMDLDAFNSDILLSLQRATSLSHATGADLFPRTFSQKITAELFFPFFLRVRVSNVGSGVRAVVASRPSTEGVGRR